MIPECRAVVLTGSTFAYDRYLATSTATERGIRVGNTDSKFFDCIDRQLHVCSDSTNRVICYINTIESECALIIARPGNLAGRCRSGLNTDQLICLTSERRH